MAGLWSVLAKFLLLPLIVAAVMFMLVHFQLMLIDRIFNMGIGRHRRTKYSIITFFSFFGAVLALVIIMEFLA